MPDAQYNSAYGYDKAHPVFSFIKDAVTNKWRPVSSEDMGLSVSGDLNISGLVVNTDDLERIASGQLFLLSAISGFLAPAQVYPFFIRSSNADVAIAEQVTSITYSNIGTGNGIIFMGSNQKVLAPDESVSFDGYNNYLSAPRFISSGTTLIVNGTSKISSVTSL